MSKDIGHTQEPWRVSGTGHLCSGNTVIPYDDLKASARRICAAINACAGISTENLETLAVKPSLTAMVDEVTKQRDDLLAALKSCANALEHRDKNAWEVRQAKAAIAKVSHE